MKVQGSLRPVAQSVEIELTKVTSKPGGLFEAECDTEEGDVSHLAATQKISGTKLLADKASEDAPEAVPYASQHHGRVAKTLDILKAFADLFIHVLFKPIKSIYEHIKNQININDPLCLKKDLKRTKREILGIRKRLSKDPLLSKDMQSFISLLEKMETEEVQKLQSAIDVGSTGYSSSEYIEELKCSVQYMNTKLFAVRYNVENLTCCLVVLGMEIAEIENQVFTVQTKKLIALKSLRTKVQDKIQEVHRDLLNTLFESEDESCKKIRAFREKVFTPEMARIKLLSRSKAMYSI